VSRKNLQGPDLGVQIGFQELPSGVTGAKRT